MARDPASTRQRILSSAGALFYKHGVHSVGVDAVAQAAGVTKRTLYYHFGSKDELVAAYLRSRDERTRRWLVGAAQGAGDSPAAQLAGLFAALAEWARGDNFAGCPFARAAAELAGEPDHPALPVAAEHKRQFQGWLEELARRAGVDDPELSGHQLVVLVDGAITEMLVRRDPVYAEAAGRAALTLIGAPAARLSPPPGDEGSA